MDLSTIANIATALTVLIGVAFGLIEMRRARRDREERAAFAAVRTILTPEWMRSMVIVHSIPDGISAAAVKADPQILSAVHSVGMTLEGLGYSVYARIVSLRVVADLVGGTIRVVWRKVRPYVEEERRESGSQKSFEWFEWLALQLDRHSPGETNLSRAAYQVYANWKP